MANEKSKQLKDILPVSVVLTCLGVIVTIFIPIVVLVIQDGAELRIDKLVIMHEVLSLDWYIGMLFATLVLVFLKVSFEGNAIVQKITSVLLALLLALLMLCSYAMYQNSVSWIGDVPISVSSDNTSISNPTLNSFLSENDFENFAIVRPSKISSYKKRARLSYINNAKTISQKELYWEIFWNDSLRLVVNAGSNMEDDDQKIADQSFKIFQNHIKEIGSHVDETEQCSILSSTLVMLKFENKTWRAKLWSSLISEYIINALINMNIYDGTRSCWLYSLPEYFAKVRLDIGSDENLEILAKSLGEGFYSPIVRESYAHADLSSLEKDYVIEFYDMLLNSPTVKDFYEKFSVWVRVKSSNL